jgi:hypothetical protein
VPTVYHKLLAAIAASSEEERQRVKRGLQEHVRLMVCGSAALVFFFLVYDRSTCAAALWCAGLPRWYQFIFVYYRSTCAFWCEGL